MHVSIKAETLFHIGNFAVTNTILTSWLVVLVISLLAFYLKGKLTKSPTSKSVLLVEVVFEKLIDFLQVFAGTKEKVKKFFPLVATIFFYVLISNWMGTLPGVETIGLKETHDKEVVFVTEEEKAHAPKDEIVAFESGKFETLKTEEKEIHEESKSSEEHEEKLIPLLRTVFSDLNMTLVLALITVLATHVIGFSSIGPKHHIGKFLVNPLKSPIGFFVGILELIGEVSRVVSLTFRLFGNIFAGSVLMLIISHLAGFIIPIPFLGLELFVGFIQALVFAVLTMLFIASATEMHHEEEHH
jgi:F-type H+-transporting ATPase subunit a